MPSKKSKVLEIVKMSVEEFIAIADNPIQRSTIDHATKASRPNGHLSITHEVHAMVTIAETESGKRWKLDGHSRAFLWEQQILEPPEGGVLVTRIMVKNRAGAIAEYRKFDNTAATENARDKVFGAFRIHQFNPHHQLLFNSSGLLTAIRYITGITHDNPGAITKMEIDVLLKPWIESLRVFDQGDFTNHFCFRGPVTLSACLCFRAHGSVALSYFQGLHDDIGVKNAKTCDGIFLGSSISNLLRLEAENRGGRRILAAYTPYYLYAFDSWLAGERVKPFGSILGRRVPDYIPTISDWYDKNIGDIDFPDLIDTTEFELV